MKDYEQLYYDELYKNKKMQKRINKLEDEIQELNICRTDKNINLQKYLINQIKKYKKED